MPTKSRTAAERQRAAAIRDWAVAEGLTVARQGRLPRSVEAAYDAATAAADDGGPPPNWAEAGAADALDLDIPEPEPDPPATAAAGDAAPAAGVPPDPEPGPPPPASLDDARERLAGPGRRVPPWAGSRGGGGSQRPAAPPVKVTAALTREIQGNLALFLTLPAAGLAAVDPACGGAVADNVDNIVIKATPLICQSPAAVKFLTEGGKWMLWFGLGAAVLPVAKVAYSHHIAGTITVDDHGRVVPSERLPDGRVVPVPADRGGAQPEPDWSQYTTDIPGHVPPVQYAG
jgi:Lsr2